jgi:hypothetical protein
MRTLGHRLRRLGLTNAIALASFPLSVIATVLAAGSFYFSYIKEDSGLIGKINHGWIEGKTSVSYGAYVVNGTLDVTFIFSNDGNKPVVVERIIWGVRADRLTPSENDECDLDLVTTARLFGRDTVFDRFPLVVSADSFEILDLKFPFQFPTAIASIEAGVKSCFTIVFTDFLGREFRRSVEAFRF